MSPLGLLSCTSQRNRPRYRQSPRNWAGYGQSLLQSAAGPFNNEFGLSDTGRQVPPTARFWLYRCRTRSFREGRVTDPQKGQDIRARAR